MKELQRKHKMRRSLYSMPTIIVLFVFTFFIVKGTMGVLEKEWESAKLANQLKGQAISLSAREQDLKDGISRLQTKEGLENEIRGKFNVTQEGEHVAVIVDDKKVTNVNNTSPTHWYQKLWATFKGLW